MVRTISDAVGVWFGVGLDVPGDLTFADELVEIVLRGTSAFGVSSARADVNCGSPIGRFSKGVTFDCSTSVKNGYFY